jgi:hypothetical protein
MPRSYKRRVGAMSSFDSELSFARQAMKRGPEGVKLKNLHCQKPLLGNGW